MNERPDPKRIKEGFVDPELEKRAARTPAPELEKPPIETAQEEEIQIEKETWPVVVRLLHKPIRDNTRNEVRELSFREPRGGDINRYGNPVRFNQEGDLVIDERKMHFMMAALCGILPPLLEDLDTRDWMACAHRLVRFFVPDYRGWVLPKTTSSSTATD